MADAILASSGIYAIRNLNNGKMYVGSAVNVRKRWNNHRSSLLNNKHHSRKLQNSWNKHGQEAFVFEVLERVTDKTKLIELEQKWIDENNSYHAGYNSREKAKSSLGMKQTEHFMKTMSAFLNGNQYGLGKKRTPEQRKAMSERMTGFKHSAETVEKMREISKKQILSDETKAKISASLIGNLRTLGYKHSEETKKKVSLSLVGNQRALGMRHTQEARDKMSATRKGRVLSAEVRARMAAAQQKRFAQKRLDKAAADQLQKAA